ncbi:interleukin-2 receptor subunit beta isoform X1 [Takifugu flavidus]|uniref:interleukin-2 receptor subunit beta isoform X1 n=1 Tax=Takifugu flavidus TaxID=433684 RepID=UPI002544CE7D|nr:interleukin-2 receptor subunit beta isoform X1 [Takifugu flavidus]
MATHRCLHLLILLLSLDVASPADGPEVPGLLCVNDYVNTVTCGWHGAARAPGANCSISGVEKIRIVRKGSREIIRSCSLEQLGNSPPSCSVVFETEFNPYRKIPSIRMECDGALVENLTAYQPRSHIKMNPPTAPVVNTTANDSWISWGPSAPWSRFESGEFHVQIKQTNQQWEEAKDLYTQVQKLRVPSSKMTGLCDVRVRVRPNKSPNKYWSNWSPTTSWFVETERDEISDWTLDLMPLATRLILSLGVICVVILVLYAGCFRKSVYKKKPVPNPSKYFCTLQSLYEGNLKAWLNPAEAFFITQPIDGISAIEVCDAAVASVSPPSSVFPSAPMQSDASGSSPSLSSFFNVGYFPSSSFSGSAPAVHSPASSAYPDEGDSGDAGVSGSLCSSFGNTRSYESLKRESQSPDSGFSFRKEDESKETDSEVSGDQICPLLGLLPQRPPKPPLLSPPHLSSGDPPVDSAEGGSVCRSSSMNEQPCRTGYLTLKELHMTFSNKSI